jgi:hypothetical protein
MHSVADRSIRWIRGAWSPPDATARTAAARASRRTPGPTRGRCGRTAAAPTRSPCAARRLIVEVALDRAGQQVEVGVRAVGELADDRGTTQPQVGVTRPGGDHRRRPGSMVDQHRADEVLSRLVDDVPPGTRDDHVPVQGKCVGVLPHPRRPVPGDGDRGVPLLAVGGAVPPRADGVLPVCSVAWRERRQVWPEQRAELRGTQPVVGHRRPHVAPLGLGPCRVTGRRQLGAQLLERDHDQARASRSVRCGSSVSRQHVHV